MSEEKDFTGLEVTQGSFALCKVTVTEKRYLVVEFMIAKIQNSGNIIIKGTLKPQYQASENLLVALEKFKSQLCKVRSVEVGKQSRINVKGLKLSGSEDKRAYEILGTEKSENDQSMGLDTHKIHFSAGTYGNEEEIRKKCDEMEILVFGYLFAGEQAQMTLPLDDDQNDGTPQTTPKHEPSPKEGETNIQDAEVVE